MSLIRCKKKPLGFDGSEVRFADDLRLKVHERVSPAQYSPREASCGCSSRRGTNHCQTPFLSTSARFNQDEFRAFNANLAQFYDMRTFVDHLKAKNRNRFMPLMPLTHATGDPSFLPFCSHNLTQLLSTKSAKLNERTTRKKSLLTLLLTKLKAQN